MVILYFIIMYIGSRLDAGLIYFVAASLWYCWWVFSGDDD